MAESFWAGPGVAGMVWMGAGASGAVASCVSKCRGSPFAKRGVPPGWDDRVMADSRAAARREGSGPSAGWPSWARRLVTAGLLFHLAAVVAGALGVPPSSELERRDREPVHALSRPGGPGLCLPLLRRASADARGHGDDPLRRRPARRDPPAPRAIARRPADAAPAAARPGQCALRRRPGGEEAWR